MAKKPTLKDLLGQSDRRVQVEYKGVTEAVTPAVVPSSGSPIPVQEMPKTNQLLQVVEAMNKLPKAYATQIGIAQTEAAEELAKLSDTEIASAIAENDKNTMSIFGFNKAYNEGLVKRHYQVNATQYEQRLNNIAANLADNPDIKDFNAALENEVETIKEENAQLFSNNRFQLETNDAAFQEVMGEYVAKASGNYLANQQEAVITQYNTDWMEEIRAGVDTTTAFDNYRTKLKTLPISNANKNTLLLQQTEAGFNILVQNGEFTKAEKLLDDAEKYEIVKGGKLGAGKNSNTFSRLRDELTSKAETKNEVTVSRQVQRVTGLYNTVSSDLMFNEASNEGVADLITTLRPNLPDDVVGMMVDQIMSTEGRIEKVTALNSLINDLGNNQYAGDAEGLDAISMPSDITAEVADRLGTLTSKFENEIRLKPIELFIGLSPEQEANLITAGKAHFKETNDSIQGFMFKQGLHGVKPPKELFDVFNSAHKLDYLDDLESVKNLSNTLSTNLNSAVFDLPSYQAKGTTSVQRQAIKAKLESDLIDEEMTIKRKVEVFASTLTGTFEEKEKQINQFIKDEVNSFVEVRALVQEAEGIYDATIQKDKAALNRRDFNTTDDRDSTLESKVLGQTEALEAFGVNVEQTYPHIYEANYSINQLRRTQFQSSDIILIPTRDKKGNVIGQKEQSLRGLYDSIRNINDKRALAITQRLYGYSTFDPKSAEDLQKSGLTSPEVKLFGSEEELFAKRDQYEAVLKSYDQDPDALTDTERKTLEEMSSFGIFDSESFEFFFDAQTRNIFEF